MLTKSMYWFQILKNNKYIVLLFIFLMTLVFITKDYIIHDFGNYYFGSVLYKLQLFSSEIYSPCYFNSTIKELGYEGFLGTYYPFTPVTTLFFYPLVFLEPYLAKIVFNSTSVIVFIYAIYKAKKFFKIPNYLLLIVPVLFFIPLRNNIVFGQVYILIAALLLLSYMYYKNNKKWRSALLLSVAICLKIFPILLIFFFLVRKDFKQVFKILVCCILIFSISLFINGFDVWYFYLTEVLFTYMSGNTGLDYKLNHQSTYIFLKFLFVKNSYLNLNPLIDNPSFFIIVFILFKSCLITIGLLLRKIINNQALEFGIWILISMLISPTGSTYSLILLIIPLFAYLSKAEVINKKRLIVITVLILLISNTPWDLFQSDFIILRFPRLFFMLTLLTLFLKWSFRKFSKHTFLILFLSFSSIQMLISNSKVSNSNTVYGGKSIICDYKISDTTLIVKEYQLLGVTEKKLNMYAVKNDEFEVRLKNNQIFLSNKQITNTSDFKLKPMVINNSIYYLTDMNQGYKFYSLNSIALP